MYLAENGIIYIQEGIKSKNQEKEVVIKSYFGLKNKVEGQVDLTTVTVDQLVTVNLKWQVFDLTKETYIDNPDNQDDFNISVIDDTNVELLADVVTTSEGSFTISFPQVGEYIIRTTNQLVDNDEIKVVVE